MQIGFNDNSFVSIGKKERAFEILKNDFSSFDTAAGIGKADGKISKQDLTAVLQNATGQYSPEDMAVAKFILNTPDLQTNPGVNMFDAAAGSDGLLTKSEIDNKLAIYYQRQAPNETTTPPTQPTPPDNNNFGYDVNNPSADTNQKALQHFEQIRSKLDQAAGMDVQDGIVGREDMQAALNDTSGKFSDEDKASIKYIMQAQQNCSGATLWEAMNGPDDKVDLTDIRYAEQQNLDPSQISDNSLCADGSGDKGSTPPFPPGVIDFVNKFGNQGYDINNPSADTNQKALQHFEQIRSKLDQAAGMDVQDGIVGREDMQAALNDTSGKFTDEDKASIKYIMQAQQGGGATLWEAMNGADDKVDLTDIRYAEQQNLDPSQISDNSLCADGSGNTPPPPQDNNYGYDINNPAAGTNRGAMKYLEQLRPKLDQAAGLDVQDGIVGQQDMQAALNDNTGKFSDQDKAVIRYIMEAKQSGGSTLWEALNGADGMVNLTDIRRAEQQTLDPRQITDNSLSSDG